MKIKLLAALLTTCAFSTVALADASYELKLKRLEGGHFTCSVDAPANLDVFIETTNVKVKGPGCSSGKLHLKAKDLNDYAFRWRPRGLNPKVTVTVFGDAKQLYCVDDQAGRPEAPGDDCLFPNH